MIASGDITSRAKRAGGARDDRRGRRHGRPRRAGQPVGAARDPRRRRARADARGGRRGAAALHPRDRARARRAAGAGLPEEVLRLVPRPRPLPDAVQAGARAARRPSTRSRRGCSPPRPGARFVLERLVEEQPTVRRGHCSTLPISVYGGGKRSERCAESPADRRQAVPVEHLDSNAERRTCSSRRTAEEARPWAYDADRVEAREPRPSSTNAPSDLVEPRASASAASTCGEPRRMLTGPRGRAARRPRRRRGRRDRLPDGSPRRRRRRHPTASLVGGHVASSP